MDEETTSIGDELSVAAGVGDGEDVEAGAGDAAALGEDSASVAAPAWTPSRTELQELIGETVAQQFGTTREKIITNSVKDVFDLKLECAKQQQNPIYAQYGIEVDAVEVRGSLVEAAQALTADAAAEKAALQPTSAQ